MKNSLLIILFGMSLMASAQYPNYRSNRDDGFHYKAVVSLAAGPETVLGFPPKVSFHAYFPRQRFVYGGLDVGLCSFGFSKTLGATVGIKMNVFLVENTFAWTSVFQSDAANKMWISNNPKVGIEIRKFQFKVGPSFVIREYNGHHDILDWFKIGSQYFNIEIGYIFDSN